MKLLDLLVQEFISITEHLLQNYHINENNRIVIDRKEFQTLLTKYAFLTFHEKCRIYKQLNFILHDKNNYTLPCRIEGKTTRKVVINYNTYEIVKALQEVDI